MIYLLDTSALVHLLRDPKLQEGWYDAIDAEAIGSCYPQRAEFLYSARHAAEYDEIAEMFGDLYPDVAVPKTAGRWISSVQYQMARAGQPPPTDRKRSRENAAGPDSAGPVVCPASPASPDPDPGSRRGHPPRATGVTQTNGRLLRHATR